MDEYDYEDSEYNEEPNYHSYRYNQPNQKDDWYENDDLED